MNYYDINISFSEDENKSEQNFFYQRFTDETHTGKVRKIIQVINDFPPDKPFRLGTPQLTIDLLNGLTQDATNMSHQTGQSINWELLKLLNHWIDENL